MIMICMFVVFLVVVFICCLRIIDIVIEMEKRGFLGIYCFSFGDCMVLC